MSFYFIVFSTILTSIFGYLRYKYNYWDMQGVKQLPTHFLFGNIFKIKTFHTSELVHETYAAFKNSAQIAGTYIFTKPIAVLLNLDLVKTILIKDFNKFVDRTTHRNEIEDPLSGHLFLLYGEKWRKMRTKLTPTFTSGKMKFMFPTIVNVAKKFGEAFEHEVAASTDNCIELYDINARFTTDVIGTCVFGLECNSLKDPNVEFRQVGRRIFRAQKTVLWHLFRSTYLPVLKYFGFKRFSKEMENFFIRLVRDTVETREKHNIKRNDFVNLLIELKNSTELDGMPGLTVEQIAAQMFVFFAAGFETSSSNMSYALYQLAKNPEKQQKLRSEINAVLERHNNELTYEAMMDMQYLDQVVTETLRMYPALAVLTRIAGEDYNVPGTNVVIEKGITVFVPVKEIHYDADIYDNPYEFRPERFEANKVNKRHTQAFLGFGDGPRNCIGLRFGRMQARVGLITIIKSFQISVCDKTPINLQPSKYSFVLVPGEDVWLKAEKL